MSQDVQGPPRIQKEGRKKRVEPSKAALMKTEISCLTVILPRFAGYLVNKPLQVAGILEYNAWPRRKASRVTVKFRGQFFFSQGHDPSKVITVYNQRGRRPSLL